MNQAEIVDALKTLPRDVADFPGFVRDEIEKVERRNLSRTHEVLMLTKRFDDAFKYAHTLHQKQTRKESSIPYITHLMNVAALVIEHGGNEDQPIAALLHDAAEDQGGAATLAEIRQRIGDAVADIISDCTDSWTEPKPDWRPARRPTLQACRRSPNSR